MRKMLVALVAVMALTVGCGHAQVPPTTHSVALTWGATTSGGTGPYVYVMSRVTVATGVKTCPDPTALPLAYVPLNSSNPVTTVTYNDTTASGTVCYVVQSKDSVNAYSAASNTAGPLVMPTNPNAPVTLGGAVTADLQQPALPQPTEGPDAPKTVAKLEAHIR
jgi:hypothetical protein